MLRCAHNKNKTKNILLKGREKVMWTRKELKARAKASFKRSYWKCVLVAFILTLIGGAASGGSSGFSSGMNTIINNHAATQAIDEDTDENYDEVTEGDTTEDPYYVDPESDLTVNYDTENGVYVVNGEALTDEDTAMAGFVFVIVFMVVMTIIMAIAIVFDIFIINPLILGCNRYFYKNLDEDGNISNIVYAFEHGYKKIVKAMFMRDLFIVLWSLLFIIPGIVKSYEYRLVPYIMSEDPELDYKEALAQSKALMKGQKWRTFVLDLSFIGWEILSAFTCGILSLFFVTPYRCSTEATLYEALRYGNAE